MDAYIRQIEAVRARAQGIVTDLIQMEESAKKIRSPPKAP